jgi:hypothetical protein
LLTPWVRGYRRVPEPPAKMMPTLEFEDIKIRPMLVKKIIF